MELFVYLIVGFVLASGFIYWFGKSQNSEMRSIFIDYDGDPDPTLMIPALLFATVCWPMVIVVSLAMIVGKLIAKYALWLYNKGNSKAKG